MADVGACRYHLIAQPIGRHRLHKRDTQHVKQSLQTFRNWLYSWMTLGGVETHAEYKLSLQRLQWFLNNHNTMTHPDMKENAILLSDFLEKNVLPHEERWLFPRRRGRRTFGETTTSSGESINASIKRGSDGVKPSMGLASSAATLNRKKETKVSENNLKSATASDSTPTWCETATMGKYDKPCCRTFIAACHFLTKVVLLCFRTRH